MLISAAHLTSKGYLNIYKYKTYYTQLPSGVARGEKYDEPYIKATTIKVKLSTYSLSIAAVYQVFWSLTITSINLSDTLAGKFITQNNYNAKRQHCG